MHSIGETVNMLNHLSFLIILELFAHYKKGMSLQASATLLLFLLHLVQKHAKGFVPWDLQPWCLQLCFYYSSGVLSMSAQGA